MNQANILLVEINFSDTLVKFCYHLSIQEVDTFHDTRIISFMVFKTQISHWKGLGSFGGNLWCPYSKSLPVLLFDIFYEFACFWAEIIWKRSHFPTLPQPPTTRQLEVSWVIKHPFWGEICDIEGKFMILSPCTHSMVNDKMLKCVKIQILA